MRCGACARRPQDPISEDPVPTGTAPCLHARELLGSFERRMPNLFELLQRNLPLAVPPENVALVGGWSRSTRLYETPVQDGNEGSSVDVVDAVWTGTVECKGPTVGIAFSQHGDTVHWIKSPPATFNQPLRVALSGHGHFGGGWGEGSLPTVPVSLRADWVETRPMGALATTTGVPHVLCEIDDVTLFIVLVQGSLVRTGRCRNWRLRPQPAALLPAELQMIFMQRRTGTWRTLRGERASAPDGSR